MQQGWDGRCYAFFIDYYEKAITESPDFKGWVEASCFYLGSAYQKAGRKEDAVNAFEKCLELGQGIRDSEGFPVNLARERIDWIKQYLVSPPHAWCCLLKPDLVILW